MLRFKKGQLKYYQGLNPIELNRYLDKFPKHTEYVRSFLEKYKYNWLKKKWTTGKTISTERY